jgi:peptide deformylase
MFVMQYCDKDEGYDFAQNLVIINPKIINTTGEQISTEGCLSSPNNYINAKRFEFVLAKYQDELGNWHEKQFHGRNAVVFQHEYDHLQGIYYLTRL